MMTRTNFRPAALATLAFAAALAAAPAFAQDRFVAPSDATTVHARPLHAVPVVEAGSVVVPPNVMGQYTCAFNEPHYHLERKNCGGVHYRY